MLLARQPSMAIRKGRNVNRASIRESWAVMTGLRSYALPSGQSQRVEVETLGLQTAQEVQEVLLYSLREVVEVIDDRVRFRRSERRIPRALVRLDCLQEVRGSPVVKEEDALPQAPQGCGSKLIALCLSLDDVVGQIRSHGMNQEVGKEVDGLVPKRRHRRIARRQHRRVTERAPGPHERAAPNADRGRAAWRVGRRSGRRQEPLEESEFLDRAQSGRSGRDLSVGDIIGDSGELAMRILLALLLEQLVRDAHLDVVGLAREHQQRLVLGLPSEPGNRSIIAIVVRVPRDCPSRHGDVGAAHDAELVLSGGAVRLVRQNQTVRNLLDEPSAEGRRRNPEDHVVARSLHREVGLGQNAPAGRRPPRDGGAIVHAAIPGPVLVELEPGFAHRPVQRDEERDSVGAAVLRGERHLRVHERAGAARRRLGVTAGAAVQVHPRAEPVGNSLDCLEVRLAIDKELALPDGQPGDRSTCARRPTAHAWIARGGRSTGNDGSGRGRLGLKRPSDAQQQKHRNGEDSLRLPDRFHLGTTQRKHVEFEPRSPPSA
jgi:hypothetical protein